MRSAGLKRLIRIPLMTALIVICSWIQIPISPPITLQTLGIFLALSLLGGPDGTASVLLYVLLGAVGLPVFAGFCGGVGYILGISGGFILGFIAIALLYTALEPLLAKTRIRLAILLSLCSAVNYICGILWFVFVYTDGGIGTFSYAIAVMVLPFVIPDAIKIFLTVITSERIKLHVYKKSS